MPIITKKGSLFDAPSGYEQVLVHSCNTQGVWGAGVAAQFRNRFPVSYLQYVDACRQRPALGDYAINWENNYWVASLFASEGYGTRRDSPENILENTRKAVDALLRMTSVPVRHYHSPKINAGLFGVPWEDTLDVLEPLVKTYNTTWTVWEL